jgi:hypothetical protein
MDVSRDLELGAEQGGSLSPSSVGRGSNAPSAARQTALLLVPNRSRGQSLDDYPPPPRQRSLSGTATGREESLRSVSSVRVCPSSEEGAAQALTDLVSLTARDSFVPLDFCLVLLSPATGPHKEESHSSPSSAAAPAPQCESLEEVRVEELLLHAEGGLHSVHDIYGVPSSPTRDEEGSVRSRRGDSKQQEEQKAEESECVICLTEKKDIFLLPCRSLSLTHSVSFPTPLRHMCVCRGCFIHIDKCPVCRTPFNTYVLVQDSDTAVRLPSPGTAAGGRGPEEV